MKYCSTRGGVHGWDFRDVLFSGYAPDGGMFMPESIPTLTPETLRCWSGLSYPKLVAEVASIFIPSRLIPREDLNVLVHSALSGFAVPDVIRIVQLNDGLSILELFHGDTLAFKDLAMTCTVRFLNYFLQKEKRRATVLVGTSGDTGGSAIQSAKGLCGVDVVVVYPRGRITPVQEKQMITCLEDNIHVFAADGSSDDIDQPLRHLFADLELVKSYGLMSLNSVNWSRILIQLAHFIYAYLQLSGMAQDEAHQPLPELEVVVPTGGAGNIAAGFIVKMMGLPLKLVAMVNANDIVHRTVTSGDFTMARNVTRTLAPAIDIQDPYNMERVFWLLLERDCAAVKNIMEEFQQLHRYTLLEKHHKLLSRTLSSGTVNDEGIIAIMRRCWEENQYVLCPHTAVAVWHHFHCPHDPAVKRCYFATASPAKFQASLRRAGLNFDLPDAIKALDKLPSRFQNLERTSDWCKDWEQRLRMTIQSVSSARKNGVAFYR
ncbi:threonine synthase-like 2 isoform X1 [Hippocampus zosterae]|uniref:threonine synthase-like 2 isoform X1 n=2 Tax=Hippocampus zosterae TaxID=109293 RepID=UPI00223D7AB1|nr:threonine synthase-like 2 isoform X1 [Hippocampus zosterae]XP_051907824.1 threonine synthase-like 2 isoform X1 [Hippocampus zosterae]XP_051907825.1 threonine synthase-like 2 isoform X1 [Hippocampus zosterae]XP_051907826.1 threonine synthase-like 2 isoform X1 [Hippocampus zosterae]